MMGDCSGEYVKHKGEYLIYHTYTCYHCENKTIMTEFGISIEQADQPFGCLTIFDQPLFWVCPICDAKVSTNLMNSHVMIGVLKNLEKRGL